MARNDGIDRTSARNVDVPDKDIGNTQKHNEREKDSYAAASCAVDKGVCFTLNRRDSDTVTYASYISG